MPWCDTHTIHRAHVVAATSGPPKEQCFSQSIPLATQAYVALLLLLRVSTFHNNNNNNNNNNTNNNYTNNNNTKKRNKNNCSFT